jgi:hypothetical protein
MMTALSCLGLGLAFAIAVALLVLGSVLIGWLLPIRRPRPPDPADAPDKG